MPVAVGRLLALALVVAIANPVRAQQVLPPFQPVPTSKREAVINFTNMAPPGAPAQLDERSGSYIDPFGKQVQYRSDEAELQIRTDLPGPDRLFDTRKSESMMREYIRREAQVRNGSERVLFPDYPPLTKDPFVPRAFARGSTLVEPSYVCHGRLLFEQPNFERGGWEIGYLTPGICGAIFYYDLFMIPYHSYTNPCACYDCSAGKCSPGDASPFYLYREQFSVSGLAAQTLAVGGGFFAFP